MQLVTKHFGTIEIEDKGIIDFPEGLPGFEDVKKFILLSSQEEGALFQWLQSVDKPDLAFVVINPMAFKPDYDIDIPDDEVAILEINDLSKVLVFTIVVVPEDITKMTANLMAPIIINTVTNKAKQVVVEKSGYKTRHYILDELRRNGG